MEEGPLITGVEVTASVKQLLWQTPMDGCDCPEYLKALDVVELTWLTHLCKIAWTVIGTVLLD